MRQRAQFAQHNNVSSKMGYYHGWIVISGGPWFSRLMQELRFFLIASVDERAERRYKEISVSC